MFRTASRALAAITLLGLGLLPAAPAAFADAPTQQVTLAGSEFAYAPSTITLIVGQPVTLTLVNTGVMDHDLKSALPIAGLSYQFADNPADEQAENIQQNVLDVDYGVGKTAQITFTPTTPGTYAFNCDQPGHTEGGMVGTFVVQAAS
jgi:uncharacterized cupredoxin-like copper-binding protein